MMSYEQFVFWLAGYLSGSRENDDDVTVTEIRDVLNSILNPSSTEIAATKLFGER